MANKINSVLMTYQVEQNRSLKSSIFDFWEKRKDISEELYLLAQILLGVPVTQVSVERLFSGLKYILPPIRSNIKSKILEEQLLLRTNKIFSKNEQEKKIFTIQKKD